MVPTRRHSYVHGMQRKLRSGAIEMAFAMSLSGTIGWFVLAADRPVMETVFARCFFGALVLAASCWWSGLLKPLPPPRTIGLAMLGGFAIVINWLLLFASFPLASISIATAVYNVQPFMLLFLGACLFGEQVTRAKLAWLSLAFAGLLMIVAAGAGAPGSNYFLGVGLSFAAAVGWAISAVVAKRLTGTSPRLIALCNVVVGLVVLAPFVDFSDLPTRPITWVWLIIIGVVHTGLVFVLMFDAVQKLPTHLQGSLSYLYPAVAITVDVTALGHRLHATQVAGIAAILIAAAGMNGLFSGWLNRLRKPVDN